MNSTLPLGATPTAQGAHFAVRSRHAERVELCLFDASGERRLPLQKVDEERHQVFVASLKAGQHYGFRAYGPWDEASGHRFDASKLLIDPYGPEVSTHADWHEDLAKRGVDTARFMPKSVLRPALADVKPLPPQRPSLIYEVPVKAFTMLHPEVPNHQRGTVAALAHPAIIAHFKKIGCDTIELMPIAAWTDERHLARAGLRNAWGYNPVSFFAPEPSLAPGGLAEIRDAIQTLHDNGLRVILDVVFNHTGESDFGGGTFSLRGLDNATYFRMKDGALVNDTGCGNTLALDQPACVQLVISALRHWVLQCGVDGFRYDLATVLGRTATGFSQQAPLIEAILKDPVIAPLLHIAEPWDIGPGGYQLGNFPSNWLEWNDHFRDDVRRFWRGDAGAHRHFATRLAGSSDIFNRQGRRPSASVNFVAAHDGFALADVPRFAKKQNQANGENNRDGSDGEVSWVAQNPDAKIKAMLASLFMARGTIMLTAGDEFGRSQGGNNNAYAQDNETTWRDWSKSDQTLIEFVSQLVRFRRENQEFFTDAFLNGITQDGNHIRDVMWFGHDGRELTVPDWESEKLEALGMLIRSEALNTRIALIFKIADSAEPVVLPLPSSGQIWKRLDFVDPDFGVEAFIERSV